MPAGNYLLPLAPCGDQSNSGWASDDLISPKYGPRVRQSYSGSAGRRCRTPGCFDPPWTWLYFFVMDYRYRECDGILFASEEEIVFQMT